MSRTRRPPRSGSSGNHADAHRHERSGPRKLAERVTMAVSAVIVAAVAGFLVYQTTLDDTPLASVDVRALVEEASSKNGRHILPVRVVNRGRRTLRDFTGEVTHVSADGAERRAEFTIAYLAAGAEETIYVFLDRRPAEAGVQVRALAYTLE